MDPTLLSVACMRIFEYETADASTASEKFIMRDPVFKSKLKEVALGDMMSFTIFDAAIAEDKAIGLIELELIHQIQCFPPMRVL
jgi:hypothetical protein